MGRTARRPLHRQAISPRAALVFGGLLGVAAIGELWRTTNVLSAVLAGVAIAFYVGVYTAVLKRRTASNIVWGGAAGCMPVLIGWSAVTNSLAWAPVVLFAVIFFWTPPHFWALAIRFRDDYARAGVPMLPVVATETVVADRIVVYSWAMVAASLVLWPVAGTTAFYPLAAAVLGGWFLREAHGLARARAGRRAGTVGAAVPGVDPLPVGAVLLRRGRRTAPTAALTDPGGAAHRRAGGPPGGSASCRRAR